MNIIRHAEKGDISRGNINADMRTAPALPGTRVPPCCTRAVNILIMACKRAGKLARVTEEAPNLAWAAIGDAPFCAKSINDEAGVRGCLPLTSTAASSGW